ncbi:Uncharacterized protein PBTT_07543 [Plasmodiophora brassicae]
MARPWSSCMVVVLTLLVVGARGSGSELPSWLVSVTEEEMHSAPRYRSPRGPVQPEMSSADDVDPKAQLGEAAVQATMARDFLKSVLQDAVPMIDTNRYRQKRIKRSLQEVVELIAPMMAQDVPDVLSWVYSHSSMASVQSWIAAAEPGSQDDAFNIAQAVYKLIKLSQGEVISAARYDERFCDFVIEEPGGLTWRLLSLDPSGGRCQNQDQENMFLTDEMVKAHQPDLYMMYAMTMSDPTDIENIKNMIDIARTLEENDALSYNLFLRVEELAHYSAVFRALFPLIRNHPLYDRIDETPSLYLDELMLSVDDKLQRILIASMNYVTKVEHYQQDSCYTIRDWQNSGKRTEVVKATMRAAMKAAAWEVFEVQVDDDLTTPLFPLKEPKTRNKRAKKTKKKRRQPESDAGLYAKYDEGMGSASTSLGVGDVQSSSCDDSGAGQWSCEVGDYVQQAPEGAGQWSYRAGDHVHQAYEGAGHCSYEGGGYAHQAYEDGQASYDAGDSALEAFEHLAITPTHVTDDQYERSYLNEGTGQYWQDTVASGSSVLPSSPTKRGRRSRRKAAAAARCDHQGRDDAVPTATRLPDELPTRLDRFVTTMSAHFKMRQSCTQGTLHFYDKETGESVFSMHRPHGKKNADIRPDVLNRIHSSLRAYEDQRR